MSELFTDMAKRAFSFLELSGFRLARVNADQLRYESASSVVVIDWDTRSGELEASVGLRSSGGQPQDMYSITDVLGMEGVSDRKAPAQVADENRLKPFVDQLAEDIRAHAQPALKGDHKFYGRLETFRHANAEAFTRNMKLQQVRSEAEIAWQKREFEKVVRFYATIETDLTEAEKRKLEYARQHLTD